MKSKIETHIRNLSSGEARKRKKTAVVLLDVAENAENRVVVDQARAIPSLVELLCDEDVEVRRNAADALSSLTVSTENKVLVARAGAIPLLVGLLHDADLETRRLAAGVLLDIVHNNTSNQRALITAQYIPVLRKLLTTEGNVAITIRVQAVLDQCQPILAEQAEILAKERSVPASISATTTNSGGITGGEIHGITCGEFTKMSAELQAFEQHTVQELQAQLEAERLERARLEAVHQARKEALVQIQIKNRQLEARIAELEYVLETSNPSVAALKEYYLSRSSFFSTSSSIFDSNDRDVIIRTLKDRAQENPGGASEETLQQFGLK